MKQLDLYAILDKLERLKNLKSPLDDFNKFINWEIYRKSLSSMYSYFKGKGGRPPYDPVLMFKIVFLQKLYNLSDDEMEYQLLDRISFQKFVGLELGDSIPDSKTIWFFRERLKEYDMSENLFNELFKWIEEQGKLVKNGSSIDGSLVDAPKQRNTREENKQIKEGQIPAEWFNFPHKLAQKDVDADWKLKNGISTFGYGNHITMDNASKLITGFLVTKASVHDSKAAIELLKLLDPNQNLYADSAYHSEEIRLIMLQKNIEGKIIIKKKKGKELRKIDKDKNKRISKIRARVEHVFADIHSFHGDMLRTIGMERAKVQISLANIVYNIRRFCYLSRA